MASIGAGAGDIATAGGGADGRATGSIAGGGADTSTAIVIVGVASTGPATGTFTVMAGVTATTK